MDVFAHILDLFDECSESKQQYEKILQLGHSLLPLPDQDRQKEFLVAGCQSRVYLSAEFLEDQIFFRADSDALISRGLAALLILAYSGHSPQFVLTQKPTFIESLEMTQILSPGRSSGLGSMYLHMQKLSLKFLQSIS